jgi:acetyl-CoA carboxylase carboxyltransferase component
MLGSGGVGVAAGVAGLHAWGRAARAVARCSGIVPVVLVVDGPAVSATALLLGLADIVVMTSDSYAFVSGPKMVAEMTGVELDADKLGGSTVLARSSGVPWLVVSDVAGALDAAADVLSYLPDHGDAEPALAPTGLTRDELEADVDSLDAAIPAASTGSYDVRRIVEACCDDDTVLEVRGRWAPNLVTAFARIDGRSVGIIANQPLSIAGTLDIPAAQKGAAFVALCDTFNLPIITFVDTPGYFPGKDLEWRGMIRHGAQMAYAYAEATVPRICVVTRKAYGGAYIVMDSRTMGSDVVLAWPSAELAVMGAKGAVQILFRRETDAQRAERELEYADTYLNPYIAAERGLVDRVIAPHETRRDLVRSLRMLSTKRENLRPKVHGNTPL